MQHSITLTLSRQDLRCTIMILTAHEELAGAAEAPYDVQLTRLIDRLIAAERDKHDTPYLSRCTCRHVGDAPRTDHNDDGHGACKKCSCIRFTWQRFLTTTERAAYQPSKTTSSR